MHKIMIDDRKSTLWNLSCSTPYNKSESKNKNRASIKNGNIITPISPIIIDTQKGINSTDKSNRILTMIL